MVLVGGHNARREHFVSRLLDLPLEIYGKWGRQARFNFALRKHVKAKGVWGEALLRLYNTSKIVLNITNWDPARYIALNQRAFDVPATGAFLLTDYSPELEEHYRKRSLLGVSVTAEDVAQAALFLASDRSAKTTGCIISVDGGVREAFPR